MNKVRINILSPGRFHVCDLARELDKNGFDVRFYSFVPTNRAMKFGLPKHCSASIFFLMFPFLGICKLFSRSSKLKRLRISAQDYITGFIMRHADVVIAMSGDFVYAPKKAKQKGSLIIYERGSKHILEQRRILESIPYFSESKPVPDINVVRELKSYQLADYIAIASKHVYESFIKCAYPKERLFINPYGVDLSDFYPISNIEKKYDVIMVGGWSYRKGCDLIIEAIRLTGLSFLHIGSLVDMSFPEEKGFTHVGIVDQKQLVRYYNQAKIFFLPSREEGLAMVQAQAIACNLPLVGSSNSGAEDLQQMVEFPEFITVVKKYTVDAVVSALHTAMMNYRQLQGCIYAGNAIKELTWEAYGKRYATFLNRIITEKKM